MTDKSLQLEVVSTEKSIFSGEVLSLTVYGVMGKIGIFPGHAQLVTNLKPGDLCMQLADSVEENFYVSGGIIEVQPFEVTILADTVLREEELDEERALEAKKHAEQMLKKGKTKLDYAKAHAELTESIAQIRLIQNLRKKK